MKLNIYTFEVTAHAPNGGSEVFYKTAKATTREEARDQVIVRCERIDALFPGAFSEVAQ